MNTRLAAGFALLMWCALWSRLCGAAVHTVAPGQSLAEALARAADGDEIQLLAGEHRGQVGVITQRQLTLRGVGGRAVLDAAGRHAEGKAILVVRNGDVRLENIEFRGARVPDQNGAGIRFERGSLHVHRCAFVDNEKGILTANFADAELQVTDSEFGPAPAGARLPHLLYVGQIARFTLQGSRLSGGDHGHLVKSRARENHVRYNWIVDGPQGRAAYELEFPNGGVTFVVGNVIGQSEHTTNAAMLSFGAEGNATGEQVLQVVNNTFVNTASRGVFVRLHRLRIGAPVDLRLANNLWVGGGTLDIGFSGEPASNLRAQPADLAAEPNLFRLPPGSPLRGRGEAPGRWRDVPLQPVAEFVSPAGTRPIAPRSSWNPGAFQD